MHIPLTETLQTIGALLAGGVVGLAFGQLQQAASRRHGALQQAGRLNSGWAIMPGSFRRVAFLLLALVLVQVLCPALFANTGQWWVSAGVVIGYGVVLARQLRQRWGGNPKRSG